MTQIRERYLKQETIKIAIEKGCDVHPTQTDLIQDIDYYAPQVLQDWLLSKSIRVFTKHYPSGMWSYEIHVPHKDGAAAGWQRQEPWLRESFQDIGDALERGLVEGLKLL